MRALERTGEVRAAALDAGIDYTTAYQRRKSHPDFAESWEQATAAHKDAARREEAELLAAIAAGRGEEAPLPPTAAQGGPPSPRQQRGAGSRWTAAAEKRFFAVLADQANVRKAAKAAGFSTNAIYQRRAKNKLFAAGWDAAVETGKARLQMLLINAAEKTFDPELIEPASEVPDVSASEAIRILQTREGKERERRAAHEMSLEEQAARMSAQDMHDLRERLIEKLRRLRQRELPNRLAQGWQVDGDHMIPPGWVRDPLYVAPAEVDDAE